MTIGSAQPPVEAGPAWDIARLFPNQGAWDETDYLWLTRSARAIVEFTDGRVEVLPMPTMSHQLIVQFLSNLLMAFAKSRELGRVLFAPLRVRLRADKYREPDIVFMKSEHAARMGNEFWDGADLVIEVVSEDNRERDLVIKRDDYAQAGIPEYWIVDPRDQQVIVLRLQGRQYVEHGVFHAGEQATSVLLPGFVAPVAEIFEAGRI